MAIIAIKYIKIKRAINVVLPARKKAKKWSLCNSSHDISELIITRINPDTPT
jgi:hypothetical protein